MPFVEIHTIEGLLPPEKKAYLIEKISDLLVEVEGGGNPEFKQLVWVKINEQKPENWSLGKLRPTEEFIRGYVQKRDGGPA